MGGCAYSRPDDIDDVKQNIQNRMKLEYFPLHGRGMMIRMVLYYCNIDFDDVHVTMEDFAE